MGHFSITGLFLSIIFSSLSLPLTQSRLNQVFPIDRNIFEADEDEAAAAIEILEIYLHPTQKVMKTKFLVKYCGCKCECLFVSEGNFY